MLYNAFLWRRTFTGTRTPSARFIFPVLSPLYLITIRRRGWRFAFPFPVLLSCTTFSVYVNLSKNSSLFGAQTPAELSWGASLPVCGCKGTSVPGVSQASAPLFYRLNETFLRSHYIYNARAKLFWDIRGIFAVSGVVWDGGKRKRFLYLSEQYYFPWRWSITSIANEVLLLSHMKYYSCFHITFYFGGRCPNLYSLLAVLSVSDEEDPQRNSGKKGARILRQASLDTCPFILGYIAK